MTFEDIIKKLNNILIKGLMIHSKLTEYYKFLGLCGFETCHKYHYWKESLSHQDFNFFILTKYNQLVPEEEIDIQTVIPTNWYKYKRFDVDINTKKTAVKNGTELWLEWENNVKTQLLDIMKESDLSSHVCLYDLITQMLYDVMEEITDIEACLLNLKFVDFDSKYIVKLQDEIQCKYNSKIKELGKKLC